MLGLSSAIDTQNSQTIVFLVFGQCVTKGFLRRRWYGGVNHRLEDIQDLMICVDVCIFPQVIAALLKRLLTLHKKRFSLVHT